MLGAGAATGAGAAAIKQRRERQREQKPYVTYPSPSFDPRLLRSSRLTLS